MTLKLPLLSQWGTGDVSLAVSSHPLPTKNEETWPAEAPLPRQHAKTGGPSAHLASVTQVQGVAPELQQSAHIHCAEHVAENAEASCLQV
jgi:hypothetical protein